MSGEEAKTRFVLRGRKVVGGVAEGEALVTQQTISGWGGINEREVVEVVRRFADEQLDAFHDLRRRQYCH